MHHDNDTLNKRTIITDFICNHFNPLQYYDAYDVTIEAAKKLAIYLHAIRPVNELTADIKQTANAIASQALQDDEGLLAIALAAPALKLAVVQFREVIENPPADATNNHSYLGAYWRGLGEAWNLSDGAQFWSAPFRDCGPMQGRWLWPFSVNFLENGIK